MPRSRGPAWGSLSTMLVGVLSLSGLFATIMAEPSIPVNYCSSLNTAPMAGNYSIHQSQGLCYDFCVRKNYALAVVQGNNCWCSNFVPDTSKQVSPGQCNGPCPGYPTDFCGTDNLFGYMLGQQSPSGTTAVGQGVSKTSSKPSITSSSVETVTADGTVRTVTVMPTPTADLEENRTSSPPAASSNGSGSSGLSTGATAGVAVGTIAIVTIALVSAFLFWRRKRQRRDDESLNRSGHSPRGSSAGMGSPRSTEPGMAQTDGKPWDPMDQSGRRRSTLMPIDPRIDPNHTGIYNREQNTSRDSINTLRDDQDYSRRVHQPTKILRATNPDPDN